jgi:phospho-N-acetylmuramoyl-pentapeptide-transferase
VLTPGWAKFQISEYFYSKIRPKMDFVFHVSRVLIPKYLDVNCVLARCFFGFFSSVIIGFLLSPRIFAFLKEKKLHQIERGQDAVRELANMHKSKNGTPMMGGVAIFLSAIIPIVLFVKFNFHAILVLFVCILSGILGFADDFLKFSRRNVRGISGRKKLAIQFAISCAAFGALYLFHGNFVANVLGPFRFGGTPVLLLLVFTLVFFVLSGTSNAVNLADGLDGLALVCIIPNLVFYGIAAYVLDSGNFTACNTIHLRGVSELSVLLSCFCGSALVFLWYNAHPASVMMGDTGALMFGGLLGISALVLFVPFFLPLTGIIFVIEALSDIIQIGSIKLRHGRRVFLMAPLHHHFELSGSSEPKIVFRAGIITFIATALCMTYIFLC